MKAKPHWQPRKDHKPADGSCQKAKVTERTSCVASAVLHVGDRHSQTSLAENVAAAVTHAAEKVDKKARACIMVAGTREGRVPAEHDTQALPGT